MGTIIGDSDSAQQLAENIIKSQARIIKEIGIISKALVRLEKSFQDEDIENLKESIGRVHKKLADSMQESKVIKQFLYVYAEKLDESLMKLSDTGGMSKQHYLAAGEKSKETERALSELKSIRETLDLIPEESVGIQKAGKYKDLKGSVVGYEAHHMPPKSILRDNKEELPCILLSSEDHRQTSSYKGRMHRRGMSVLGQKNDASKINYKQMLSEQVVQGDFPDTVRNEIYEIKSKFGNKYDKALMDYMDALEQYYEEFGVPKVCSYEEKE